MNSKVMTIAKTMDFVKESLGKFYDCFVLELVDGQLYPCESNFVESENLDSYYKVVLDAIKNNKESALNTMILMPDNKFCKVSVKLIKENDEIVGAICISLKCSPFFKVENIINEFLNIEFAGEKDGGYPVTLNGIDEYFSNYHFNSAKPSKNEKTEIICDLYDMGMFDIKGAVQRVADKLGMSTKSVYRYITSVKEARE